MNVPFCQSKVMVISSDGLAPVYKNSLMVVSISVPLTASKRLRSCSLDKRSPIWRSCFFIMITGIGERSISPLAMAYSNIPFRMVRSSSAFFVETLSKIFCNTGAERFFNVKSTKQ